MKKLFINNLVRAVFYKFHVEWRRKLVYKGGLNHEVKVSKLTRDEITQVNEYWGSILTVKRKNSRCYELLKTYAGFNPKYISEEIFNSYVVRALNMPIISNGYEHKGMYGVIFNGLNQAKTVYCRINGSYFDSDNHLIEKNNAENALHSNNDVFVKSTIFSNQGKGVSYYLTSELSCSELDEKFGEDYIVQIPIVQSKRVGVFSRKSLNTFRVSTMLINGKCSLCTIMFRCGAGDSMVDNGYAGNIFVGVTQDGYFEEYGYDKWMNKHYSSDTGVVFKGHHISEVNKLVEFAIRNHQERLSLCGFVGWDLSLDENDEPLLVEVNIVSPSVYIEQLSAHRPLFGDRTDETITWVKEHGPSYLSVSTRFPY